MIDSDLKPSVKELILPQQIFQSEGEDTRLNHNFNFEENLPPPLQMLHEQAIKEIETLRDRPEAQSLLIEYSRAVGLADFTNIYTFLSVIEGSEVIGKIARQQFISQIDSIMMGVRMVLDKGSTQIFTFGYNTEFNSLQDIQTILEGMNNDIEDIKNMIADADQNEDLTSLYTRVLARLDFYLFEGRIFQEKELDFEGMMVMYGDNESDVVDRLFGNQNTEVKTLPLSRDFPQSRILDKIDLANSGDKETENIFLSLNEIPKTIIVYVPNEDFFSNHEGYGVAMQCMLIDYFRLPHDKRPKVVVYADGFKPALEERFDYQGFLFCNSMGELDNVLRLVKNLTETHKKELFDPDILTPSQKDAYENSDLREWENKTADTYQSLRHIFEVIAARNVLSRCAALRYLSFTTLDVDTLLKKQNDPKYQQFINAVRQNRRFRGDYDDNEPLTWHEAYAAIQQSQHRTPWGSNVKTCLDLGTGEGRIAQMLARVGINVLGLDISREQLNKIEDRIREEGEGLSSKVDREGLSYSALLKLQSEGLLPGEIISDDQVVLKKYQTIEGSFF